MNFAPHVLNVITSSHLVPVASAIAFVNSNFNLTIAIPINLESVWLNTSIELYNLRVLLEVIGLVT